MEFLSEYFLFLFKLVTLACVVIVVLALIKGGKDLKKKKGTIYFEDVSDEFNELKESYNDLIADEQAETDVKSEGTQKNGGSSGRKKLLIKRMILRFRKNYLSLILMVMLRQTLHRI